METEKSHAQSERAGERLISRFFNRADLQDLLDAELEGVAHAREIYAEALALEERHVPWPEIREHLLKGRELCPVISEERGPERAYEITFAGGDKISFDGTNYWFWSRWSTEQFKPPRPRPSAWVASIVDRPMKVLGSVLARSEESAIKAAIKVFQVQRALQDHIVLTRIHDKDD